MTRVYKNSNVFYIIILFVLPYKIDCQCFVAPPLPPGYPTDSSGLRPQYKQTSGGIPIDGSVLYSCPAGRTVPANIDLETVCVATNRYIGKFNNWPDCECAPPRTNNCAQLSELTFTYLNQISTIKMTIPFVTEVPKWDVQLMLNKQIGTDFTIKSVNADFLMGKRLLRLKPTNSSSSASIVLSFTPSPPNKPRAKWEYPCVSELSCFTGPDHPVTSILGSIIISSVVAGLIFLLWIWTCYCRYLTNKKLVYQREEIKKTGIAHIVLAADQDCKLNYLEKLKLGMKDEMSKPHIENDIYSGLEKLSRPISSRDQLFSSYNSDRIDKRSRVMFRNSSGKSPKSGDLIFYTNTHSARREKRKHDELDLTVDDLNSPLNMKGH
ncbi:uncharacterized protein LOC111713848 [Eurytemora carolleeae]|uniref:uncharacterized protein LOC111713848 n=1 Tax=Eurytemora carolleeae TaxID=1294199 RepID=UPI000C77EE59|nr:uncharacterized protein LOC111713848 [Eurytemora carolleeae]|eukprot:XP_023344575.1 uncharacterized protein LOC111713848 [Eurytemora affinis]